MIYQLLLVLALVGVIGWQWTEIQILRQKLEESEDFCAELDPVELYNLRSYVDAEVEDV